MALVYSVSASGAATLAVQRVTCSAGSAGPISNQVEYEWIFQRDSQQVVVQRWQRPDRIWELTLIWTSGEVETEGYVDVDSLVKEHVKLERELMRSGWTLVEFRPERRKFDRRRLRKLRSGIDRRRFARPGLAREL
jgi:hypothetical protein